MKSISGIIASLIVAASLVTIQKHNENLLLLVDGRQTVTLSSNLTIFWHQYLQSLELASAASKSVQSRLSFLEQDNGIGSTVAAATGTAAELTAKGNVPQQKKEPYKDKVIATVSHTTLTKHGCANSNNDDSQQRNRWQLEANMLRTLHGTPSKVYDSKRKEGLVVYSIFAGRREPMSLQLPYILTLLEKKIVDEVHIWNYTCHAKKFIPQDSLFLQEELLPSDPNRIFLMNPPAGCAWSSFYDFYSHFLSNDQDVLLKVDDDIVFLDTSRVASFVQEIRSFPQVFLWSANVINNGKAAAFQTMDGLLTGKAGVSMMEETGRRGRSIGELYRNKTLGLAIHQAFLDNPINFFQPPSTSGVVRRVKGRLSLNFIGLLGSHLEQASCLVHNHLPDDEHALTTVATFERTPAIVLIYAPLIVSHASFKVQKILQTIVPLYRNASITNPYHATLPSPILRIPDESEANTIPQ